MTVSTPRTWSPGLSVPTKPSTPPLEKPPLQIGTLPLYQWRFDSTPGAIPSADPALPTESRDGKSGNASATLSPTIANPSGVSAQFGNWLSIGAAPNTTAALTFPPIANGLDFTRFGGKLTLDFWAGADLLGAAGTALRLLANTGTVYLELDFGGLGVTATLTTSLGDIATTVGVPAGFSKATPKHFRVTIETGVPGIGPRLTVYPGLDTPGVVVGMDAATVELFGFTDGQVEIEAAGDIVIGSADAGYDNVALFKGAFSLVKALPANQNVWPGING